jgi:hypothetical protein
MTDPLHDFARQRILEGGAVRSSESVEAARRETARYNCRVAYRLTLGFGVVLTAVGVVTGAFGVAAWFGVEGTFSGASLVLLVNGGVCLLFGLPVIRASRAFDIPWELATKGSLARAVVIGVKSGGRVRKGKRVQPLVTTTVLRLAVQLGGGAPYEARTVTVDQLHGAFVTGEEIAVLVDPVRPRRVFVRES